MPGKPVAGFFHSTDPSWRTRWLETPCSYCGPNFLTPWGREQSGMRCTSTVLDQPSSTPPPRLLRASPCHAKSAFPFPLDLKPSTREGARALPPLWPRGGRGGGPPTRSGGLTQGQGTPRASQSRGPPHRRTPVPGAPGHRRPTRSGQRSDFRSGERVPDILQAAKLR